MSSKFPRVSRFLYFLALIVSTVSMVSASPVDYDDGYVILESEGRCVKATKYSLDGKSDAQPSKVIRKGMCKASGENEYLLKLSCNHAGKRGFMIYARELSECRRALGQ